MIQQVEQEVEGECWNRVLKGLEWPNMIRLRFWCTLYDCSIEGTKCCHHSIQARTIPNTEPLNHG